MMSSKRIWWIVLSLYFFINKSSCIDSATITLNDESDRTITTEESLSSVITSPTTLVTSSVFQDNNGSSTTENSTDLKLASRSLPLGDLPAVSSISPNSSSRTTMENSRNYLPVSDAILTTAVPKKNISETLQKWLHFENITKIFAKNTVKQLLPGLMKGTGSMNISASCAKDVFRLLVGLQNIRTWAFSFIDASGKFIDGMLGGTMASMGEFDQCINIKATNDRKGKNFGQVMFTGQYCTLEIKPPLPEKRKYYKLNDVLDELKEFASGDNIVNEAAKTAQFFHFLSMRVGICVPSGCGKSDIQQVIDKAVAELQWNVSVRRCELKEENNYTPTIIAVMTAMSFFGFLMAIGSFIDLYYKYAQKKINNLLLEILVCFSFVSNFKKLVNVKNASDTMSCLHGLRFLSISWIIIAHTYFNANYNIAKGLLKALEFQKDFAFQAILNASVAVDTFFFIGGLLVCYVTVKIMSETQRPFNVFLYIFHRLFRLLPVYIMVIFFIFLAPIMGSGPIWHDTVDGFVDACYKNWWTNVVFLNNFINTDQICLPQSWYVACDMQLYLAALIVIIPILRWPRVGLTIATLGILASVIGTAAQTYINDYPPTMLLVHPDEEQRLAYWANAYFKPYSHAGPYCIGLIVGYILATHPKLKFSKITRAFGWALAIACNMAVLYGVYDWNVGRDPELAETLLYSGLHRSAWAFGIAWIVINCATKQGGVVNYILSWKVWIPLGRLTYTIYLIHPIVQVAILGNARIRLQATHYFAVWIFFGHLMITIGSAFAATMLVEAPFIALEKIILRGFAGKGTSSTNERATITNESTTPKSLNSEERSGPVSHL